MSHPGADPSLANIFEDDSGIRRETGFLRRITQLQVMRDGGIIPGGYGVAWHRWGTMEFVCAPQPWHLLFGFGFRLYHAFRIGFGLPDARSLAAYDAGRRDAAKAHARELLDARHRFHEEYFLI